MIPYDDLVAALSAWRARQGLPVNQLGGGAAAAPAPGSGPHASPGSGPNGKPGSGPNRSAPPAPPPSASRPGMAAAPAEDLEVADELLDDEAYENDGTDFAVGFGGAPAADATATAQVAPERPTEADLGNDKDDW